MGTNKLNIQGMVYTDDTTREKFSKDARSYSIQPQMVAAPANETDVIRILEYAQKSGTSITCRSGGSGLSGAGIGSGIIVDFKPLMNGIKQLDRKIFAEPGVVLEAFLKEIHKKGLMLPAIPSSSSWCALGGNIGTRATGPRTARYGTIDAFVTSLKFITARGDIVDTRKKLPDYLEKGVMHIRGIKKHMIDEHPDIVPPLFHLPHKGDGLLGRHMSCCQDHMFAVKDVQKLIHGISQAFFRQDSVA
jgi:glycolate oxidase